MNWSLDVSIVASDLTVIASRIKVPVSNTENTSNNVFVTRISAKKLISYPLFNSSVCRSSENGIRNVIEGVDSPDRVSMAHELEVIRISPTHDRIQRPDDGVVIPSTRHDKTVFLVHMETTN